MKKFDVLLLGLITLLTFFGLFTIYDASSIMAFNIFADKYHFIKEQLIWVVLGFGILFFFFMFDYHKLFNMALPVLLIALVFLILVFLPGIGESAKGAHRWISFLGFSFQPAEFVKLALALYLAAWFARKEKGRFLAFTILITVILFLVMLEPDMGTASIILFEAIVVYFLSGGSILYFLIAGPLLAIIGYVLIKIEGYRADRLASFLNIERSLQSSDSTLYHIKQILIALGSGGLFGLGIGNSIQKYAYLPENVTDSIFPIIAEEIGFIGSVILILVYMIVVWRAFYIAAKAKDQFGKLLAAGIASFIGIQIIINLGAMTALIPLTGVPLPFISYGGSALVVDLASAGILLNISRQK